MYRSLLFATVVGMLILQSCGDTDEQIAEASVMDLFEENYFNSLYEAHPTVAARVGLRQYEGRLDPVTQLAIDRRIDNLKRQLVRLQSLRHGREHLVDAKLIDYAIRAEMLELGHIKGWSNRPEFYFQIPLKSLAHLVNRDFAPDSERLRSVVINLHEVGAISAALRGNLRQTTPDLGRRGLEVGRQLQRMLENELPAWADDAAGVDMTLRGNFQTAVSGAQASVEESVGWVERELITGARVRSALGPEVFIMKLLFDEMLAIPLSALIEIGEASLEWDHAEFVEHAGRMNPELTPEQVLRNLVVAGAVPENELVQTAKTMVDAANRELALENWVTVPLDTRITVVETPPYLRDGSVPVWMDLPGPGPERTAFQTEIEPRHGILFVGPPPVGASGAESAEHMRSLNRWDLQLAVFFEALPGRFLRSSSGADTSSRTRQILAARSAIDGWASYTEELIVESGFGNAEPELRLCHLRRRLVEDCRLLASVKYHTQGMTLAEAERLFIEKAFQEPAVARREALRLVYDPTYFVSLLGRLEIQRLRDDYRVAMGSQFDQRKFHQDYLDLGPIPIPLARQLLLKEE